MRRTAVLWFIAGWSSVFTAGFSPDNDFGYYSPAVPPSSRYSIDARIDAEEGLLEGRESISFKNTSQKPLQVVAFDWSIGKSSPLEVSSAGRKLFPRAEDTVEPEKGPVFVRMARALEPGARIALDVKFSQHEDVPKDLTELSASRWYPRLWWDGLALHDSYSVKLAVPAGWTMAASGRLDPKSGRYEAAAAATFGIYLAKGAKMATRESDGVLITSIFTEKGARAAAICLETAADAVHFYKQWLGFYPFPFLTIIPGGAGRWGGNPVATGIVAIHGLETYVEGESPQHWQHITSHEIGHQYWGEWVLDPDQPAWLWIALGIFADTEFMTTRRFDPDRRAEWMGNYINSIPLYYDTALDITSDLEQKIRYDYNNIVIHSKGPAAIWALDSVLGRDVFLGIYKKCLRDYGGKRLGWREFQRVCETESGRSLQWFFDSWVRSSQYLCYRVDSSACHPDPGGYRCEVAVRRLGTMSMPVPVKAVFEDGTEQTLSTDRDSAVTVLSLASKARLRDVVLDPERKLAMSKRPRAKISDAAMARLAYGAQPGDAPDVYAAIKDEPIQSADLWYTLGTGLYDSDHLTEALDCFHKVDRLEADAVTRFAARAWLGLLEDLRGNRAAALDRYREALEIDPGKAMTHGWLRITIDTAWLKARLQKPFTRESDFSLPANATASDLVSVVNRLNYTHEGKSPFLVFEKTRGLDIRDAGFWFRLGLMLFDSGYYEEALASFESVNALEQSGVRAFAAKAWQGHLNDLLGNRQKARECYREALKLDTGSSMEHSQYRMVIDRAWVEERMNTPFTWKK